MNSNTAKLEQLQWPIGAPRPAADAAPAPRAADAGGVGLTPHYVITLTTAALPIRAALPRLPAFADARVFCERYVESGVERIRVQLGYFHSMRAAAAALRVVHAGYPQATVRGVRLLPKPPRPAPRRTTERSGEAAPARGVPAPAGAGEARSERPGAVVVRRLAVELLWSPQPIDLARVPPLTLFDGYTLYAVAANRGGHDWHGLRLGFFTERSAAMAAVDEAMTYFSGAIAVPVTDSEFEQASEAEIRPFVARIGPVTFAPAAGAPD